MLDGKYSLYLVISLLIFLIPVGDAEASSNPNLFVSAENPKFDNHFSGSMVIEVVVSGSGIRDTGEGKGEPDVTLNGKTLRMIQATDGNWYAYFANVDKAKAADSTVGLAGQGLDFGVFCSRDTASSVFGISLSETDGFAVPRSGGLGAFTDGNADFVECTNSPTGSANLNNVVRKAKSINTNPNVPAGQIGLDPDAWPMIQLYSFDKVKIQYNPGGPSQQVSLHYDEIPGISMNVDREFYPENAQVFLVVNDFQLNQDPTDEDSWTFGIGANPSTFYQAYDNSGSSSANGGAGLVNLAPFLPSLGFEDNGNLDADLGTVLELRSNSAQPDTGVTDGLDTFSQIITLVEQGPSSGIFESFDSRDQSVLGILDDAPRGQTGTISYNRDSISVLTGTSTASISVREPALTIGSGESLSPGTEYSVVLYDPDQNLNSGAKDDLDVFRDGTIIPTLKIGNPITLKNARDFQFHTSSPVLAGGGDAGSFVPDSNSERLAVDTSIVANGSYEMVSVNLGITASTLNSILLDSSASNADGTNWINYDLSSFENDLGASGFDDASFTLSFGTLGTSPITIADAGDISSSQGFIQIDDSDIADMSDESGTVFLVIDFDSSDDDAGVISVASEINAQPIIFDLFSFGLENDQGINNSIYRFELEETLDNSATFEGTIEYAVTNQLNILEPDFIQTIRTIDDEIKIIIIDRLIDEEGITISYSDLNAVGKIATTSSKYDVTTHSGTVSTTSPNYRFGQTVTIILDDPDLNLKSDIRDIYPSVSDPNSPIVDTVGKDGEILLEIKLKDTRFKRCTIDDVEHGGLASTGFVLVETGASTGIFEGTFKMPSWICDKTGSKLISPAGGSLDARYYDSRDSSGNENIFSLLDSQNSSPILTSAKLSHEKVSLPKTGSVQEIVLSGSVENQKRGIPLSVTLTHPDGTTKNFGVALGSGGSYKSVLTINPNSMPGKYLVQLSYDEQDPVTLYFSVISEILPDWIKSNAKRWSSDALSDAEFMTGIKHLIDNEIIAAEYSAKSSHEQEIPDWFKNNAKWWSDNQISDDAFLKSIEYLVKKGIIQV